MIRTTRPEPGRVVPAPAGTLAPALVLLGGRLLGFAVAFCIPVVLARLLDQAEFGTYKQLFLVAGTLYGIGQLGMAESLLYFLPLAPGRGARYVANALLALTLGGLACLTFLVAEGERVAGWLSNAAVARHAPLLGLYLALMLVSAALELTLIARKRFGWAAWSYVALDLTRAAFLLGPPLLVPGLTWLLRGAVGFAALRCAVAAWALRAEFGPGLRPDLGLLRAQLAYAVPFQLSGVVEIVQGKLHQYVVAHHFDAATFAIYAVGCLDIPITELVMSAVVNVMMVRMAEARRDGDGPAVLALWHDATRKLALVFFPLVGLLLVTARPLILALFTERYRESVPIFMVLSLALLLPVLAVDGALRVHADTRWLFALNVGRLVLTVVLIGGAVARFGLLGAAAVTVLVAVAGRAAALLRVAHLLGVGPSRVVDWPGLGRIAGAATAAMGPAAALGLLLEAPPWPLLLVTAALYVAGYGAALAGLGALGPEERAALAGWRQRWSTREMEAE